MVCRQEIIELPRAGPGTRRSIVVQRFGEPGARPKAYLHAALHAQELPGIVVLDHLAGMLRDADVTGEVVIVPFANPVGLAQQVMMETPGRHDLDTGRNYNRGFPDILDEVVHTVTGRLGRGHDANVARVRRAALDVLERRSVLREDDVLKTTLLRLSLDSDYVLDLHTAWEALPHMFVSSLHWPDAGDLARDMESEVVIVDEGNPMMTFKSAHVLLWQGIARQFPTSLERPGLSGRRPRTARSEGCRRPSDPACRARAAALAPPPRRRRWGAGASSPSKVPGALDRRPAAASGPGRRHRHLCGSTRQARCQGRDVRPHSRSGQRHAPPGDRSGRGVPLHATQSPPGPPGRLFLRHRR